MKNELFNPDRKRTDTELRKKVKGVYVPYTVMCTTLKNPMQFNNLEPNDIFYLPRFNKCSLAFFMF